MKKMMFALLAAIVLVGVFSLSVFPAAADDNENLYHCECGYESLKDGAPVYKDGMDGHLEGCSKEILVWQPWSSSGSPQGEGNWYLTQLTKGGAARTISYTMRIDLNGQVLQATSLTSGTNQMYLINNGGYLAITDSTGGGQLIGAPKVTGGGGIILIQKGTLELFDGTIDASYNLSSGNGSAINVDADQTVFNMYGGAIVGGTTKAGNHGGAVYVTNGASFTMTGGKITGGSATQGGGLYIDNGSFTLSGDGTFEGNTATSGGQIYLNNGTITMTGGKITGGVSTSTNASGGGGNVYLNGGSMTVSGGEIKDGQAATEGADTTFGGGNVYIGGNAALTLSDKGSISGGKAYNGGNLNVRGTFQMTDGKLSGGEATGNSTARGGGSVYIYNGTCDITGGVIAGGTANYGGTFLLTQYNGSSNLTLKDVTVTGSKEGSVRGGVIYTTSSGGTVNIQSGAKIAGGTATNGGNIYLTSGTVTMTGGTVSDGTATGNSSASKSSDGGGNVYIGSSAAFTLSDGVIENGTAFGGGNVYAGGTFEMTGGTVKNGTSTMTGNHGGGNVFVPDGGTFNLSDTGKLECGTAGNNGGSVFVRGTFNMSGGSITGGNASKSGGNLALYGNFTMTGGTVAGGEASANTDAGNVFLVLGAMEMRGGSIEGGFRVNEGTNSTLILSDSAKVVAVNGPSLTAYDGANITVKTLDDDADIRVTMTGSNPNGQVFATQGEGFTGDMLERISYDGSPDLHPVLEGDKLVWKAPVQIGKVLYGSINDAMTAYGDGSDPIKLLTDVTETVTLTKNIVLDLNGKKLTGDISGNFKLSGIDSTSTASGDGTNVGWITGDVTVTVTDAAQVNGAIYVHVVEGNVHSFHKIELVVTSVSLRPMTEQGEPGLYFKSQIKGDAKALGSAAWLGCFGSAFTKIENANTDSDPTSEENKQYVCSEFGSDKLGAKVPGTLVSGILTSEKDENPLDTVLYCRTYMKTADNEAFFGSQVGVTLRYMLEWVDNNWSTVSNNEKQRAAFLEMYGAWHERLAELDFTFNNVGKQG